MTWQMIEEFLEAIERCRTDDSIRVLVFTGAGRAFSAGDDIVGGMGERRLGGSPGGINNDRGPALRPGQEPARAAQAGRRGAQRSLPRRRLRPVAGVRLPRRPHRDARRRHSLGSGHLRRPGRAAAAAAPDRPVARHGPAHHGPRHRRHRGRAHRLSESAVAAFDVRSRPGRVFCRSSPTVRR